VIAFFFGAWPFAGRECQRPGFIGQLEFLELMNDKMIGIAIITYNRSKFAARTYQKVVEHTKAPHEIVVVDDGSQDDTVAVLRGLGATVITGRNMGVCWNKNRGLFYLHEVRCCDVVILLEDDTAPKRDGWEEIWAEASLKHGHIGYAGPWFSHAFIGGSGTSEDPFLSTAVSGQCEGFSREALSCVGYLDSRFKGYGVGHAEHSMRFIRAGYGGKVMDPDNKDVTKRFAFHLISSDLAVSDPGGNKTPEQIRANFQVLREIQDEPVHRWCWRSDVEMRQMRSEMRMEPRPSAAICLFVKNEVVGLAEWIVHHLNIGFKRIFIYDNCSDDGTTELVQRLQKQLAIDHYIFPTNEPGKTRRRAYIDCLVRNRETYNWILFIDSDEFLVPYGANTLEDLLIENQENAAIAINWQIFGSSGLDALDGKLVMEALTRRAPVDFEVNRHVKSFVRPDKTLDVVNPHAFRIEGSYVDIRGREIEWTSPGLVEKSRIVDGPWGALHHYYVRTKTHWANRAGRDDDVRAPNVEGMFERYDRNDIVDESALPYVQAVRDALSRLSINEHQEEAMPARKPERP
jgi:glycosyltransferase involved in cell wall biosynthesis